MVSRCEECLYSIFKTKLPRPYHYRRGGLEAWQCEGGELRMFTYSSPRSRHSIRQSLWYFHHRSRGLLGNLRGGFCGPGTGQSVCFLRQLSSPVERPASDEREYIREEDSSNSELHVGYGKVFRSCDVKRIPCEYSARKWPIYTRPYNIQQLSPKSKSA